MIKKVPKCNQQTGNWNDDDVIEININVIWFYLKKQKYSNCSIWIMLKNDK